MASSLTIHDIQKYTFIIEQSRRAKNYLWSTEPIAIWPDWHEGLFHAFTESPMSPKLEQRLEYYGSLISRPPSRGRSAASPILAPLPVASRDARSLSPGFYLESKIPIHDSEYDSSNDFSGTSLETNKTMRHHQHLSINTMNPNNKNQNIHHHRGGFASPHASEVATPDSSTTPSRRGTRSHSDGDLSAYLRGFSDLKGSLQLAQMTCNNEIKKILEELQEHVEKSMEVSNNPAPVFFNREKSDEFSSSYCIIPKSLGIIRTVSTKALPHEEPGSSSPQMHVQNSNEVSSQDEGSKDFDGNTRLHHPIRDQHRKSSLGAGAVKMSSTHSTSPLRPKPGHFDFSSLDDVSMMNGMKERILSPLGRGEDGLRVSISPEISMNTSPDAQFMPQSPIIGAIHNGRAKHKSPVKKRASLTSSPDRNTNFESLLLFGARQKSSPGKRHGSASVSSSPDTDSLLIPTRQKMHRKINSDSFRLAADLKPQHDSPSPFMEAISSVISLAQGILQLDLSDLMESQVPQYYITQIMKLQSLWMEHPEWQLQELVVRLMIVFASVARLAEHFEEDFQSWSNLNVVHSKARGGVGKGGRRDSLTSSLGRSPARADSPFSIGAKPQFFSAGAESSDTGGDFDEYFSDDYSSQNSPPRRFSAGFGKKSVAENHMQMASLMAFRAAVDEDQSINVLMELNGKGKVTYVSPGVTKVFQFTQAQVLNATIIPFLIDGVSSPFVEAVAGTTKLKPNVEIIMEAKKADGSSIRIDCNGLANFDEKSDEITNVVWLLRPRVVNAVDSVMMNDLEPLPNLDMALCNICDKTIPAIHFSIHTDLCLKVHKSEMSLVLMMDEIKNLKQTCDERNNEISALKIQLENGLNDPEMVARLPQVEKLLVFLSNLYNLGSDIRSCIDQLLSIKIPKAETIDYAYELAFEAILWRCQDQSAFMLERGILDDTLEMSETVMSLGLGLYMVAKSLEDCISQKRCHSINLRDQLVLYLECLEEEQMLTIQIGIQTAVANNQTGDNEIPPSGAEKESTVKQELSGTYDTLGIHIPSSSMDNSQLRASPTADNQKNLDTEIATPISALSIAIKPATPSPSGKLKPKLSSLRIQTDQEPQNVSGRRGSIKGGTRMMVGDKSFEVELDTVLSPTARQSVNQGLASPLARGSSLGFANVANTSLLVSRSFSPRGPSFNGKLPTGPTSTSRNTLLTNSPATSVSRNSLHGSSSQRFSVAPQSPGLLPKQPSAIQSMTRGQFIPFGGSGSNSNLPRTLSSVTPTASNAVSLPSIKDYEIIKPISKGAFGSVFLAKKKISGQYYAIKVLRKSDMVAKNQAMNIKSERTILTQLDSPYVVKLFSTFQSKNHIYLVMEYLNGGDCAALLKSLGQLDEDWAKQYITEMVQGLEFLHEKDIVHR